MGHVQWVMLHISLLVPHLIGDDLVGKWLAKPDDMYFLPRSPRKILTT